MAMLPRPPRSPRSSGCLLPQTSAVNTRSVFLAASADTCLKKSGTKNLRREKKRKTIGAIAFVLGCKIFKHQSASRLSKIPYSHKQKQTEMQPEQQCRQNAPILGTLASILLVSGLARRLYMTPRAAPRCWQVRSRWAVAGSGGQSPPCWLCHKAPRTEPAWPAPRRGGTDGTDLYQIIYAESPPPGRFTRPPCQPSPRRAEFEY